MTDQDLQQVATWQVSPEGSAYLAVYELDGAIDKLTALSQSREGAKFIQRELANIRAAEMRLRDLLADMQPVLVAAE